VRRVAFVVLALFALAQLASLAGSAAPAAFACTCGAINFRHASLNAETVVVGSVSEQRVGSERDSGTDCGKYRIEQGTVSVERYVKGSGAPQIPYRASRGFCSEGLKTDKRLLLFVSEGGDVESVECCANSELVEVEQALHLTPGSVYSLTAASGDNDDTPWIILGAVSAVISLAVFAAALAWPRRRA
jgi:hypothetical protein